jgi:hypothetical protein
MIILFSGEGPSDLGGWSSTDKGKVFAAGPMAWLVDRILGRAEKLNYSVIEVNFGGANCVQCLTESELSALSPVRTFFLRRGSDGMGNQYFRKQAYLIGKYAKQIRTQRRCPVIAVFFRDADGTASSPADEWRLKFASMLSGFQAAEFSSGVPMVPRPKSEAWMLCGLMKHQNGSQNCHWLEEESGNDASPNSLKKQLADYIGYDRHPTAEEQAELVRNGRIDPERIDLPSFLAFREALDIAFANAVNRN